MQHGRTRILLHILVLCGLVAVCFSTPARAWNKTITFAGSANWKPLCFLDEEGRPSGILVDYWNLWAEKNNAAIEFSLVSWSKSIELVRAGKADALVGLAYSMERDRFLDFGPPLMELMSGVFARKGMGVWDVEDLGDTPVGVVEGDYALEVLESDHPEVRLRTFPSNPPLIEAVERGHIDAAVMDFHGDNRILESAFPVFKEFSLVHVITQARLHPAVAKGNHALLDHIAHGMYHLSSEDRAALESRWKLLTLILTRNDAAMAVFGLILLVLLGMGTGIWILKGRLKRQNRELAESENKLRNLVEYAPVGIFRTTADGRIKDTNQALAAFHGFDSSRAMIEGVEYVPDLYEDPSRREVFLGGLRRNGRVLNFLAGLKRADGATYWASISGRAIYDNDGRMTELEGFVDDVTERVQAEEARRESESRYQRLYENLLDGLAATNPKGDIIECNQAFLDMLGYSRQELVGRNFRDITPPQWIETDSLHFWEQAMVQGHTDLYEKEYMRKDGTTFPVEIRVYLARDKKGNPVRVWALIRDISERTKAGLALERAKEAAEEANRAKGVFLATLSHEIRTPLNTITGMTDLCLAANKDSQVGDNLRIIKDAAAHLLEIISDILEFSKIEAGKVEIEALDFDLHANISQVVRTMAPQAQRKGISLKLEMEEESTRFVKGDPVRYRQILINLVGNAIKFTDKGGVTIRVLREAQASRHEDRLLIRTEVADTGIGIPPEQQESVFMSFTQADHAATRQYGGTGLGLSICRRLCELMGGSISVDSAVGKGSTFSFFIPFEPGSRDLAAGEAVEKNRSAAESLGSLNILLAEDNEINAQLTQVFLEGKGHTVVLARNGRMALEALAEKDFDIVLMDVEMPVMDGLEATRRIRGGEAGEHNRSMPVVAMTAHALNESKDACRDAGMNDFQSKPVELNDLAMVLYRNISRQAAWSHPGEQEGKPPSRPTDQAPPLLEREKGLHRTGDDEILLGRLSDLFIKEKEARIKEFRKALEKGRHGCPAAPGPLAQGNVGHHRGHGMLREQPGDGKSRHPGRTV